MATLLRVREIIHSGEVWKKVKGFVIGGGMVRKREGDGKWPFLLSE